MSIEYTHTQFDLPPSSHSVSRRALMRCGALTSAAAVLGGNTRGAEAQSRSDAPPAPSAPATRPATDTTSSITVGDVAAADRIAGRDYLNNEDRLMMLRSLEGYRDRLRAYRKTPI